MIVRTLNWSISKDITFQTTYDAAVYENKTYQIRHPGHDIVGSNSFVHVPRLGVKVLVPNQGSKTSVLTDRG